MIDNQNGKCKKGKKGFLQGFPGMPESSNKRDFVSATFGYQVPLLLAGPLIKHVTFHDARLLQHTQVAFGGST